MPVSKDFFSGDTVRDLTCELVRMADQGGPARDTLPPLIPDPARRFTPFPLTDLQWAYFLGRADDAPLGGNGCHIFWEWERPAWDVARLERAWNGLIARHDMLRAIVRADGLQQVLPEVPAYRFETADLQRASADEVAAHLAAVRERMSHECRQPDQWPLFRIAVSRLPGGMRLHLSLDLLIADALSIFLLLHEWAEAYEGPDRVLPPPRVQFRDYVLYLEQIRGHERYRRANAYWEERLEDLPPAPQLPWIRDPASLRKPTYRRLEGRLPTALWASLRRGLRSRGLTEKFRVWRLRARRSSGPLVGLAAVHDQFDPLAAIAGSCRHCKTRRRLHLHDPAWAGPE